MSRRDLDFDDDDPPAARRCQLQANRVLRDLQGAGYDAFQVGGNGAGELALVSRTAEQQAQLVAASERIDALESQRRWLWAGVGVSALVLGLVLFKRQRPAPQDQRGTKPDKQAA